MENPYEKKDVPSIMQAQVQHARRSNLVMQHIFERLDRAERAIVQQGEKQARGTKLQGDVAEIAADLKND